MEMETRLKTYLRVLCGTRNMLYAHVREAGEVTEEPTADKAQERSDGHLRLLLGQPYAQRGAEGG